MRNRYSSPSWRFILQGQKPYGRVLFANEDVCPLYVTNLEILEDRDIELISISLPSEPVTSKEHMFYEQLDATIESLRLWRKLTVRSPFDDRSPSG